MHGENAHYMLYRAIQWYKKAAEAGDKRALQRLRATAPGALPSKLMGPRRPMEAVEQPQEDEPVEATATGKQKDKDCIIM